MRRKKKCINKIILSGSKLVSNRPSFLEITVATTCGLKRKGGEGWPSSCVDMGVYHCITCTRVMVTLMLKIVIYTVLRKMCYLLLFRHFLDLAKPQWCHSRNDMAKLTPACWETEILYLAGMLRNRFQICMNWFPYFPNAKTQWCNRVVSISSSFLTVLTRHHGFYFLEMGSQFNDLEEREETLWFTLVSGSYFMSAVAWNFVWALRSLLVSLRQQFWR